MKLISGKVRRLEQIPREKGEKIYLCTYFIFMCQSIYKFMIINNFSYQILIVRVMVFKTI